MSGKKALEIHASGQTQALSPIRVTYLLLCHLIWRNKRWLQQIQAGSVSEQEFESVFRDVWAWLFSQDPSEFDMSGLGISVKTILSDYKKNPASKFTDIEETMPGNEPKPTPGARAKIKNNPKSRAIFVALGLAEYAAHSKPIKENPSRVVMRPSSIAVNYDPNYLAQINVPFNGIPRALEENRRYSSLALEIDGRPSEYNWDSSTIAEGAFTGEEYGEDFMKPLNQIFHGPPGTGKTFKSIYEAVEIIDGNLPADIKDPNVHKLTVARFEELRKEGRIGFVTFHPSYSYEEFIEGIFPVLDETAGSIAYERRAGVFKEFIDKIKTKAATKKFQGLDETSTVWRISLGRKNQLDCFDYAIKNNVIFTGFANEVDFSSRNVREYFVANPNEGGSLILPMFVEDLKVNDIVCVFNDAKSIRAIGIVRGEYEHKETEIGFNHVRKVEWIDKEVREVIAINGGKQLKTQSLHRMPSVSPHDILNLIGNSEEPRGKNLKYVFIIDEINRANISKVFGELITLVEPEKREGAETPLSSTLPYSKTTFSIPANLFLIGTMNTADKSIASLDIALRRRFIFRELATDYDRIPKDIHGVPLRKVVQKLNDLISAYLGNDYCVGHSYFEPHRIESLEALQAVWFDQVLPLIGEYFHNDWERIKSLVSPFVKLTPVSIEGESQRNAYRWIDRNQGNDFVDFLKKIAA